MSDDIDRAIRSLRIANRMYQDPEIPRSHANGNLLLGLKRLADGVADE